MTVNATAIPSTWRQQSLAYRQLRKELLLPPVGTRVWHPRNCREEGLWGPPFLKAAFWSVPRQQRRRLARSRLALLGFSPMKPTSLFVGISLVALLSDCASDDFTPF